MRGCIHRMAALCEGDDAVPSYARTAARDEDRLCVSIVRGCHAVGPYGSTLGGWRHHCNRVFDGIIKPIGPDRIASREQQSR